MHFLLAHKLGISITLFIAALVSAGVGVTTQAPQQTPVQTCADAEMRRAEADLRAAAAELHCEILKTRREEVERESTSQKAALSSAQQRLANERGHSAMLAAKNVEKDQAIDESKTLIAALTVQRDKLQRKVENANAQIGCRIFRVGCVGER